MCLLCLLHHLSRVRGQIALELFKLLSLLSLDLTVNLKRCQNLVTHPVVVECQGEVTLDLDLLHLGDKGHPLHESLPLQAKEPEDGSLGLLFPLDLLLLDHLLEGMEPPSLDH